MAACAVLYHAFARPEGYPFAVGPADPVGLLPEMAMTAELVAVIKVYVYAFFRHQDIPLIFFVARVAGKRPVFTAVHALNVTMCYLVRLSNMNFFSDVALTAPETLNNIFPGFYSERDIFVFYLCHDRIGNNMHNFACFRR